MEDPVVLLERNLHGHLWQDCCGKGLLRNFKWSTDGNKFLIENAYSCTDRKDYSFLCLWMTSNWLAGQKTVIRCGTFSTNKSIWENQHHPLIMKSLDVLTDFAKHANILLTITEPCWTPEFPQSNGKTTRLEKSEYVVLRHGRSGRRSVWNDIANWRTRLLNNETKYQFHALMTTNSKKKNLGPWENCQKYVMMTPSYIFLRTMKRESR